MLTCQRLTEIVTDYLEGRLPFFQRMQFRLHVGMCQHCREYLRQMRLTVHAAGSLPPPPMPPEVRDELLRRFRDWDVGSAQSADDDGSRNEG